MYRLVVFLTLVAASIAIRADKVQIQQRILEDVINSTIESLRPSLPDPLTLDDLEITLPDDGIINGTAAIKNLDLEGLQGFELTKLNFSIIGFELNFTLVLPDLEFKTDYELDTDVVDTIPITGHGNISASIIDFELEVSARVNLTDGISISSLWLQIYLGEDSKIDIEGLFDDPEISKLLTDILNDLLPTLIDDNQELISDLLSPIIKDLLNLILGDLLGGDPTEPPLVL